MDKFRNHIKNIYHSYGKNIIVIYSTAVFLFFALMFGIFSSIKSKINQRQSLNYVKFIHSMEEADIDLQIEEFTKEFNSTNHKMIKFLLGSSLLAKIDQSIDYENQEDFSNAMAIADKTLNIRSIPSVFRDQLIIIKMNMMMNASIDPEEVYSVFKSIKSTSLYRDHALAMLSSYFLMLGASERLLEIPEFNEDSQFSEHMGSSELQEVRKIILSSQ